MSNPYSRNQKPSSMYPTVPDRGRELEPCMAGLRGHPELNSHLSSGTQQLDFMDTPAPRTFLAPENYSSTRRGSCCSDTLGSQYAWSTASNADLLANSPALSSLEPSACSGPTSPYMQSYYPSSHIQPAINTPDMSTYSPQQINKWCIETNPTGDFYPSYPAIHAGAMPYPPTTDLQADHFTHSDSLSTANDWLSMPAFTDPIPIPESFFPVSIPQPQSQQPIPSSTTTTTTTAASNTSSTGTRPSPTRSFSDNPSPPNSTNDLTHYGIPTADGAWRCAHRGCSSQAVFRRGCDLRKHFNRHRKYLFCRHEGCPQAAQNGFSSKKDRARHEAKHNPGIVCEAAGCGRVFSRVDNMKDHVRRIHRRGDGR